MMLSTSLLQPVVSAESVKSFEATRNDMPWFNPNETVACSSTISDSGTVDVSGDNVKDAFGALVGAGYSAAQAAGIVGNLMQESTAIINPKATDGVAVGIAQWQGDRLPKMRAWVAAQAPPNNDPTAFGGQMAYLIYDLQHDYKRADTAVRATNSPSDAAQKFEQIYEAAGDPQMDKRINNANSVFAKYGGDAAALAAASPSSSASAGCAVVNNASSPDCVNASGGAHILCEARKYAGIYYTYGGAHDGYAPFKARCTPSVLATAAASSSKANPGPCSTDCSSLVSIAVDDAYGQKFMWVVRDIETDTKDWRKIPSIDQAQPGDAVTVGDEHVELFDHYTGGKIYTFGSHQTGTQTGPSNASAGYYDGIYRYIGPGSSVSI